MDDFLFNFRNDVSVDFSPGVSPTVTLTATRELTKDVADLIAEINGIKNYNSESLKSILNRKDNKMNNANPHMDIVDYTYTPVDKYDDRGNKTTYMKTTLSFRDNTETSVLCPVDKADKYYGFYACYAKHIAGGNKINDEAEYWIETLPKKLEKERLAEEKTLAEEKKIEERDKKRREKKRVRMEAIRRKEAYDAAKLAIAKYGFPVITMNIDGLHQRAGSRNVIPIHGRLPEPHELYANNFNELTGLPVLYGDNAPEYEIAIDKVNELRDGDKFIIVGVSFYTMISEQLRYIASCREADIIILNECATVEVPEICKRLHDNGYAGL